MTTYWLLGENNEDRSDDEYDFTEQNDDEGIDEDDDISTHATVTFLVSDHDNGTEDKHVNHVYNS